MNPSTHDRVGYESSCRLLQALGLLEPGDIPPVPDHRPRHDDEEPLGVSFFRTSVGEGDLENLSLLRTFIGRSEVGPISFRNSDLSESGLCWNDFIDVDFSDCDLPDSDLRASIFKSVKFVRANLRNTDFRRSHFERCDFTDAEMLGAKLARIQAKMVRLSPKQQREIDWQAEEGPEPDGG